MSAVSPEARQAILDEEHLRLLSIAHYVSGGLCILFSSFFLFHFAFLALAAANPGFFPASPGQAGAPDTAFFGFMAAFVGTLIALGWTFGGLTIYSGRCIKRRTKRTFTLVMAVLNLLGIPFGTLLGIATLIVLLRPSVKALYGSPA